MNQSLDALLDHPAIWRAGKPVPASHTKRIRSDYPALDAILPGGGWPRGALTEVLYDHDGIGELRLLMPALARLSHEGGWIALVAPPHIPYAPALCQYGIELSRVLLIHPQDRTDSLWAVEQALRTGTCGAVLAWPRRIDDRSLRRLQLAAEAGDTLGVLFRETATAEHPSPAALRLRLSREKNASPQARILKCRGGTRYDKLPVDLDNPPVPTVGGATNTAAPRHRTAARASTRTPARGEQQQARGRSSAANRAAQMDLPLVATEAGDLDPERGPNGRNGNPANRQH